MKKKEIIGDYNAKTYAITSGKGGVGKTTFALNAAIILSKMKLKTLLIDADLGLANVDVMLGITPEHTLEDVIEKRIDIHDVFVDGPYGLKILPAASAIGPVGHLSIEDTRIIHGYITGLARTFQYILIDTGSGISSNVTDFVFMAQEVIVVMTKEPTAITDAYAMVKIVSMASDRPGIGVIINQAKNSSEAEELYGKFLEITRRFLDIPILNRGHILSDENVTRSILKQEPLVIEFPGTPASKCIASISKDLYESPVGSLKGYN